MNAGQLKPKERYKIFLQLVELIQTEKLTVPIEHLFPLEQAAAAHAFVESQEQFGKVVLLPEK